MIYEKWTKRRLRNGKIGIIEKPDKRILAIFWGFFKKDIRLLGALEYGCI